MNLKSIKQPSNFEVAKVLREKKMLSSRLYDIRPKNWSEANYREWGIITGQIIEKQIIPTNVCTKPIRVMRIADGFIFPSVNHYVKTEGLYKVIAEKYLVEEILYKKIETLPVVKLKKPKDRGRECIKVERIADGHIFKSISECIRSEQFYKVEMRQLLLEKIRYRVVS